MDGKNALKKENKALLIKYGVCFAVGLLIAFIVFWIEGFFTDDLFDNLRILQNGFFVSAVAYLFLAGIMYVSGEGGLIGISYVMRNVLLFFIPGGRAKHELYKDYRERKIAAVKRSSNSCFLITGLVFLAVTIILSIIWNSCFGHVS